MEGTEPVHGDRVPLMLPLELYMILRQGIKNGKVEKLCMFSGNILVKKAIP